MSLQTIALWRHLPVRSTNSAQIAVDIAVHTATGTLFAQIGRVAEVAHQTVALRSIVPQRAARGTVIVYA